jgi:two-component system CheB/CheR fusion protein
MEGHPPIAAGWFRGAATIAAVRELQTANEQQQALNEELETSQEQLRAANEQLQASNQVLRRKVGELAQANNDLNNLMGAADIATIFLDRALQITRFTPQAQQLFNLISTDRGRPLAHITHTLDYQQLLSDTANVLATLQRVEREVRGADGRWYLARLHPYRTDDERIDGVVLTCVDITARRLAEEAVRDARDELELRVMQRTEELAMANRQLQAEIAERTQLEQGRQELLRKLVTMQEGERRRIARELHDQLGQSVSAFGMGLMMLANPSVDAIQHQQTVARLQEIAVQIDQDLNQLAFELRPSALDDLGLVAAVQHHVEQWAARTGIRAEIQTSGLQAARLPSELESVIYRVIQEALTNVLKHAAAQAVSVVLERRHDQVHVIVEDDGRGFDLDALLQAPEAHQRLGLLGMQERVALVGGKLTIEAELGAGTALFIRIPVTPPVSPEQAHA